MASTSEAVAHSRRVEARSTKRAVEPYDRESAKSLSIITKETLQAVQLRITAQLFGRVREGRQAASAIDGVSATRRALPGRGIAFAAVNALAVRSAKSASKRVRVMRHHSGASLHRMHSGTIKNSASRLHN